MPRRIHILPDHLVNQIAAGEVVERPASVVKELVENALDAGARRVTIAMRNGGKTEIRVADDGYGMGRDDALLALDRHATSKLTDRAELSAIRTLGFRGEALPSIASVARVTMETAERDGDGTRVVVNGGHVTDVESCARRTGTTVAVRSLFYNVPARAKFLRSAAAEARAISEASITLALANPGIAFSLESNDRPLLTVEPAAELRARIGSVWGDEFAAQLIPVTYDVPGVTITGLIQRPHAATPGPRRTYLFVNGRSFSDRHLIRAADRGYQTTIAPGVRPSLFLFLDVPEGQVDVNVHPTKAEVRFRDGIGVERAVEEGVRAALAPLVSTPSLGAQAPAEPSYGGPGWGETAAPNEWVAPPRPHPDAAARASEMQQMSLFVARAGSDAEPGEAIDLLPDAPNSRPAMWQVHNTYIFTETRGGLIIVDQHSAHERVMYEQIMRDFDGRDRDSQRLLFPVTLRLSPAEFSVVEELGGLLSRMGFEVEPFGGRAVIIHAVPSPHPYFDAERCLRDMIAELTEGSPLVDAARTQHQRLALTFACKAAIKAGQRLSQGEMEELFDRLFATELPYHDIHGRPTVIQLSLHELHNRFRRSG
jgi:DNA mismatch repair protein MutL